ncbi:MAG: Fructose-phosphate phosphatase YqaB, partial [Pseudomonadota bacterium]
QEKEAATEALLVSVKPYPSVLQLVIDLHGQKPMAVVSGGSRKLVHHLLEHTQLRSYFSAVISFEDTPRGKPHPDPFLEAASRLRVPPQDCVVLEDGEAGIQGAWLAGMRVIRVSSEGQLSVCLKRED